MATTAAPRALHVLETCLYVKSAPKAAAFYQNLLGVAPHFVTVSGPSFPVPTPFLAVPLTANTYLHNPPPFFPQRITH